MWQIKKGENMSIYEEMKREKLNKLHNELEDLLEECKKCDCWSEELEACDEIVLCDKKEKIIDLYIELSKLN
jgi:tRNA threonylcarbamoyladenosine modification (KEOPS) complex Cgi121 subunit